MPLRQQQCVTRCSGAIARAPTPPTPPLALTAPVMAGMADEGVGEGDELAGGADSKRQGCSNTAASAVLASL
eukprot:364480-Chlamydomonas_euryale.AAC.5